MKKILIWASFWNLSVGAIAQTNVFEQREVVKTVVLDAGHGGHDSGCAAHGHLEKRNNLSIVLLLGALIQQHYPQIQVIYTRTEDVFIPLEQRAGIANAQNADLFLSVHCNFHHSRKHSPTGTETYYFNAENQINAGLQIDSAGHFLPVKKRFRGEKSRKMAFFVENAMQSVTKRHSRGVKTDALKVLYLTQMPSVLSEIGFLTNAQEGAYISSEAGQNQIAQALFQAFETYIEPLPQRNLPTLMTSIPLREMPTEIYSMQSGK
jgi:N-acetylmuramoyl-L-alanine amidase